MLTRHTHLVRADKLWKQEVLSDDEYHCFKILTLQHDPTILASSLAAGRCPANLNIAIKHYFAKMCNMLRFAVNLFCDFLFYLAFPL